MARSSSVSYRAITRAKALSLPDSYHHAVHAMLHSPYPVERKLFGRYTVKHAVVMQLRFDGTFGFPGGYVDHGESLEDALKRELVEELGEGVCNVDINESNLVASHLCSDKPLCLHFYSKEVKMSVLVDIEKRMHDAALYGLETLGLVRCPLYTLHDNVGGLPAFLKNNFIGNSREQLIIGILGEGILTEEQIELAVARSGVPRLQNASCES